MQPAFLLSHSWRDDAQGTELSFWWHTPEGTVLQKVRQASVCFIAQAQQQQAQQIADLLKWPVTIKPVPLRFFNQQPAAACYLPEGFKARWRELLQEQGIALKEADIRAPERYLMERFVYGKAWLQQPWQQQQGYWLALDKSIKPLAIKWQPQLKALALDIETSSLRTDQSSQLYAISFYADDLQLVLMQGKGENTSTLRFYADEPSLLKALLQVLQEYDPDAILGWNLVQFDFSFLLAKFRQYQIPFALGRDGSELKLRPNYNNPEQVQAVLAGRVILDGISQLKNATYQLDSFALNDVAEYFLQDHKLLQSDDLGQDIEQLFHSDKAQLAAYNLKDSELVWRIFQQADLLNFAIERSSLTGLLMGRVGGSVAAFENLYLPRLHRAGYVAPNSEDGLFADTPGGYVMDSTAGFYQHVLVLDFKSLYPSIMRTFGIDPMGLVEGLRASKTERVPGFLGGQFHRTLHLLPDILTELTQSREAAKLNGNKAISQAIKIIMASCYGVLGSGGCRFHDSRLAGSITLRGHEIIQRSAKWVQAQGYDVIYGDTDSLFIWLKNSVADEQIDQVGNSLRTGLNLFWQTQLKQHFGLTSYLEIEYETHYRRFFMPAIRGTQEGSKKRYAGLKADRLIFKGLEAVRSDWTELAKNFQRELYRRIFYDEPYHQWLIEQVQDLLLGHKDHELIYQKRLGQALSAYQKQVPPHARAAKQLNQWLKQRHLPERFGYRGGRIRYLMTLNGPEPIWPDGQSNSPIDYQHYLEKQMRPLADAILQVRGEDFASLAMPQLNLF